MWASEAECLVAPVTSCGTWISYLHLKPPSVSSFVESVTRMSISQGPCEVQRGNSHKAKSLGHDIQMVADRDLFK